MYRLKIVGILIVGFIVVLVATGQTKTAADIVSSIWGGSLDFLTNFGKFISELGK